MQAVMIWAMMLNTILIHGDTLTQADPLLFTLALALSIQWHD